MKAGEFKYDIVQVTTDYNSVDDEGLTVGLIESCTGTARVGDLISSTDDNESCLGVVRDWDEESGVMRFELLLNTWQDAQG